MISSRSSVFLILSIVYLGLFSTAALAQDSKANNDSSTSKKIRLSTKLMVAGNLATAQNTSAAPHTKSKINNADTYPPQKREKPAKILLLLAMGATSIVTGITLFLVLQPEPQQAEASASPKKLSNQIKTKIYPSETFSSKLSLNPTAALQLSAFEVPLMKNWAISEDKTAVSFFSSLQSDRQTRVTDSLALDFNHSITPDTNKGYLGIFPTEMANTDVVLELIQDLQHSNVYFRRRAIWELAQKSDSRAIAPLIEMMPQVDSAEKSLILEAITQITGRSLRPLSQVLISSFQDDNPQVRKNAIRDSTLICQLIAQVSRHLSQLLEDSDLEVRQTARWALQQLNPTLGTSHTPIPEIVNNQDNLAK